MTNRLQISFWKVVLLEGSFLAGLCQSRRVLIPNYICRTFRKIEHTDSYPDGTLRQTKHSTDGTLRKTEDSGHETCTGHWRGKKKKHSRRNTQTDITLRTIPRQKTEKEHTDRTKNKDRTRRWRSTRMEHKQNRTLEQTLQKRTLR